MEHSKKIKKWASPQVHSSNSETEACRSVLNSLGTPLSLQQSRTPLSLLLFWRVLKSRHAQGHSADDHRVVVALFRCVTRRQKFVICWHYLAEQWMIQDGCGFNNFVSAHFFEQRQRVNYGSLNESVVNSWSAITTKERNNFVCETGTCTDSQTNRQIFYILVIDVYG